MQDQQKLQFPKRFYWGASTSAHQVEGGAHNQWSIWELENAVALAQRAKYQDTWLPDWQRLEPQATDPKNYISGRAADHYSKYELDFDLLTKLNMNAFRFSIEWSRIEPEEGKWDEQAIAHYRGYLAALKERKIEPFVTLWHWTVPEWFDQKGGFEKRSNVKYFVRFAEKVLTELGSDFKHVITINEPEVFIDMSYNQGKWPPMIQNKQLALKVYVNLAVAHKRVYTVARGINRKFKVGLAKNCAHHYPGDDALISRLSARLAIWGADYFFLNIVKRKLDFIGLNYYFSNRFYGYRIHNPNERQSDLGWDMQPANIEFVLERLWQKYHKPIIITENGVADATDRDRQWWITQTVMAMNRALAKGVKLQGYLHWSLLDNFEWASGFWPRFGLISVDYATMRRKARPSAVWFGMLIDKIRKQ